MTKMPLLGRVGPTCQRGWRCWCWTRVIHPEPQVGWLMGPGSGSGEGMTDVPIIITLWVKEAIPWQNFLKNCRQQRRSLAMPIVHRLRRKGLLPLLQRRTRRKKRLPNQVVSRSRSPRKVEPSPKTCASLVVKQVIGRKIAPSTKLKLKTVNLQVCLFV